MANKPDPQSRFVGQSGDIVFADELSASRSKANIMPPIATFDYWKEFDALQDDIGHSWLVDYMMAALSSLTFPDNHAPAPNEIQAILDANHGPIMDDLLGTEDNPGALVKLIMAGIAAGTAAIEHGSAANPARPVTVKAIDVDWNILAREARNFAQQYFYTLIRRVDDTTRLAVQEAVTQWIESGAGLDKLKEMLTPIFQDEARAQLIAQTESTRAYVEGSLERYRRADVQMVVWKTVNVAVGTAPGNVCLLCGEMKTRGPMAIGSFTAPPLHPGCRCWLKPSVEDM